MATPLPDRLRALAAPAPADEAPGLNRYLHTLWHLREDLQQAFPQLEGPGAVGLALWAHTGGQPQLRFPDQLLPRIPAGHEPAAIPVAPYRPPRPGPIALFDGGTPSPVLREVRCALDAAGVAADADPEDPEVLVLTCLPLARLDALDRAPGTPAPPATRRVVLADWDVDADPPGLVRILPALELWAPTATVRRHLAGAGIGPSHVVGLAAAMPTPGDDVARPPGWPGAGTVVAAAWRAGEDVRKAGVLTAIEVHASAFSPEDDVALVVLARDPAADPHAVALVREAAAVHPHVHVLDATGDAVIHADVLLTLPRADGLALEAATAASAGVVVVAPDGGEAAGLLGPDGAFLVATDPSDVGDTFASTLGGGRWHEPRLEDAVDALRSAVADPAARAARSARAAARVREHRDPARVGRAMAERLDALTRRRGLVGRLRGRR